MEIALTIVVLVIGYIWWAKKRLTRKMHCLVNAAKITVCAIFTKHLSEPGSGHESEETSLVVAAATTNFLFGETPSALHESLNLQEIHADAVEWVKRDSMLRELIVQSLRVAARLDFTEKGTIPVKGEELLRTFGREYPIAPNPDSYEQLIQKAIGTLTLDIQASIRSRFGLAS